MLEVTSEDIAGLADHDLRALIGRLCEAELCAKGLPATAAKWGGHQDAPDGGIDVEVSLPAGAMMPGGPVPRALTGYQVKKPDLGPSEIAREMRPRGLLRPAITALAERGGAYVIISGSASTSSSFLEARLAAMVAAAEDCPAAGSLALDFFDGSRVATWLRQHPGLIPWARSRAGREIVGWQSFGAWANPANGPTAEYAVDDTPRVRTGAIDNDSLLAVGTAIDRMRQILVEERRSVRLVGLSGVGKTRLVQALFDGRVGQTPLDPALAVYTNIADGPVPSPIAMLTELVTKGSRVILIVDNCPAEIHTRLTGLAASLGSRASVLTVEYDIQDDVAEGTDVFRLEPSSSALAAQLVVGRFPHLTEVEAERISALAGGNFRIALAIAGTVARNEGIGGLSDKVLFERLFRQRHPHDPDLLRAAKVCALVYSFDGEDVEAEGELAQLGSLDGIGASDLHRSVAELLRRDLVQRRSHWRAVLPHALANRLAAWALQDLPATVVDRLLVRSSSERILRSFSHRLGLMGDSPEAVRLAEQWLRPGGLLGDPATHDELLSTVFANVAPIAQPSVLAALERGQAGLAHRKTTVARLLRSLAYEPEHFDRAVNLLMSLAVEDEDPAKGEPADLLKSLFYAQLSGTHAPPEQRVRHVEQMLRSANERRRALGFATLKAMLESNHFSSGHGFDFGALSRDYGLAPRGPELVSWYRHVLLLAITLAAGDLGQDEEFRRTIGAEIGDLWRVPDLHADIEDLCRAIGASGHWAEGWLAVRSRAARPSNSGKDERLELLEGMLRPVTLLDRITAVALSSGFHSFGLEDFIDGEPDGAGPAWHRAEAISRQLGVELAADDETLARVLPQLFTAAPRLNALGFGMGQASNKPGEHWDALCDHFRRRPSGKAATQMLIGFLAGLRERDREGCEPMLDAAVADPALGAVFPMLQSYLPRHPRDGERIHQSLELGLAPIHAFVAISHGGRAWEADELAVMLREIGRRPGGNAVARSILLHRLWRSDEAAPIGHVLREVGKRLLADLVLDDRDSGEDFELATLCDIVLDGEDPNTIAAATACCCVLVEHCRAQYGDLHKYGSFLQALCKHHSRTVLETFFGGDRDEKVAFWFSDSRPNPLVALDPAVLVAWCQEIPSTRFGLAAGSVPFLANDQAEAPAWSQTALDLMGAAPDSASIAAVFVKRFPPNSWSGSRAAIIESRMALVDALTSHANAALRAFAPEATKWLVEKIAAERRHELTFDRGEERFE